jgi:hypothetical protein
MAKYKVQIMRTTWSYATVEVEAYSVQDAENQAFDIAIDGDLDFEVFDASDEVADIYPVGGSAAASDL